MKYRHACHAGNFADVVKHVVLVSVLTRLTEKDRPLFYLDTHAGRARYDLASRDSAAEAARGIGRLAAADPKGLPAPQELQSLDVIHGDGVPGLMAGKDPSTLLANLQWLFKLKPHFVPP